MIVFSGVTSGGIEYQIDDAYMAELGTQKAQKIIEEQRRIACNIVARHIEQNTQRSSEHEEGSGNPYLR